MYLHDHVGPPRNLATVQCPRSTSVQRPMTLDQRIARLRLRRRMFLLGPPAAFVLLAGLCAYLSLYPTLACWLFARFFVGRHWSRWLLAFPALWLLMIL